MSRLLIIITILWIIKKFFQILLPESKNLSKSTHTYKSTKSRKNMDIQDAEFEEVK